MSRGSNGRGSPVDVASQVATVAPPRTGAALLTADDLAARWQVPTSQVYRLTRGGELAVVRLGRYYRYRLEAVEEFERGGGGATEG